jgi:23S rRNA (guanosine2251-2'-O)-methyltransferase
MPNRPKNRRDAENTPPGENYCWGRNAVIALLEDAPSRCLKVMLSKTMQRGAADRITELCKKSGIPFLRLELHALDGIIYESSHQGVIASISPTPMRGMEDVGSLLPGPPARAMAVLLDHVQDPHNLGAMARSAEAAGAGFLALPLRRSSLPTGTVAKTSAGASLRLPFVSVGNVGAAANEMKEFGLWIVGLDAKAEKTIYSSPLPERVLFVVGGEDSGLGRTTVSACDEILSIPAAGGAGSLNAAASLAITMFEWVRLFGIKNKS